MILRHSLVKIWNMINSVISISSLFSSQPTSDFLLGALVASPQSAHLGCLPHCSVQKASPHLLSKVPLPQWKNLLAQLLSSGLSFIEVDVPEELSVSSCQSFSIWSSLSHDSLRWPQEFHWRTLPRFQSSPSVDKAYTLQRVTSSLDENFTTAWPIDFPSHSSWLWISPVPLSFPGCPKGPTTCQCAVVQNCVVRRSTPGMGKQHHFCFKLFPQMPWGAFANWMQ